MPASRASVICAVPLTRNERVAWPDSIRAAVPLCIYDEATLVGAVCASVRALRHRRVVLTSLGSVRARCSVIGKSVGARARREVEEVRFYK